MIDTFKGMILTTLFVVVVFVNVYLLVMAEGVKIYSRLEPSGLTLECVYYTPVTLFTTRIDPDGDCPVRIRMPGRRP